MKSKKQVLGVVSFTSRNIYTPPMGLLYDHWEGCGCHFLVGLGMASNIPKNWENELAAGLISEADLGWLR